MTNTFNLLVGIISQNWRLRANTIAKSKGAQI
jgi:hypothetical protein